MIPHASQPALLSQNRACLLSHSFTTDFWSLKHPSPAPPKKNKFKPYRQAQQSKLQEKFYFINFHCIIHVVNLGLKQGRSGQTSDSLKVPFGETHRAQLSRSPHFCKFIQDESNSCCTTSHVTLQIFHFRIRRLEDIKKRPRHANTYLLNRSRYFI